MNRAAQRLGVNHATVLRRIARLETEAGRPMFMRKGNDYRLTAAGQAFVGVAGDIEQMVRDLERRGEAEPYALAGTLRVTTTDSLMLGLLPDAVATFQRRHPRVVLEFNVTNHVLDLARRHADVAIRPTRAPPASLHAQRIGDLAFGVYAGEDYPLRDRPLGDPDHTWLVVDEAVMASPTLGWLTRHHPQARHALRADSFVVLGQAARRGQGLAILPCFLVRPGEGLVRVAGPLDEILTGLWILRPHDSTTLGRASAFAQTVLETLAAEHDRLAGRH